MDVRVHVRVRHGVDRERHIKPELISLARGGFDPAARRNAREHNLCDTQTEKMLFEPRLGERPRGSETMPFCKSIMIRAVFGSRTLSGMVFSLKECEYRLELGEAIKHGHTIAYIQLSCTVVLYILSTTTSLTEQQIEKDCYVTESLCVKSGFRLRARSRFIIILVSVVILSA